MPSTAKRSPLKEKPLHYPGQSINERIDDLWTSFTTYLYWACSVVLLMIIAWILNLSRKPLDPIISTVVAILVIAFCAYKAKKILDEIRQLKLALDGELTVGQFIELTRSQGAQVFHDIVGEGFNIDHVVVNPNGIFTIETKTHSKPEKGQTIISLKDGKLFANGMLIDRDPLTQARAEAHWLQELLKSSTGKKFPVKPVVIFPGWFVEPMKGNEDVWVLNPQALPGFIAHTSTSLPQEDIYLISYHLSRYIRAKGLEK
jgi:hypothetical protein